MLSCVIVDAVVGQGDATRNVALRIPMTLDQFLRWEERQERKYEFDGVQPVAMTGVRAAHSAVQRNLITALANRLRGQRCQVHGSELKIEVVGRIHYPDAFVIGTPVAPSATVVHDPVVVFEILSEGTAANDLVVKNAEYRATPSVQRYVVLQQIVAEAIVFSQRDGEWVPEMLGGDAVLAMPEIGVELPLSEVYEGMEFAEPES